MDIMPGANKSRRMGNLTQKLKNTSLTLRIISGLALGILTGLMQMKILPYVILSLIVGRTGHHVDGR